LPGLVRVTNQAFDMTSPSGKQGKAAPQWLAIPFAVAFGAFCTSVAAADLVEVYAKARQSDPRFLATMHELRAVEAEVDQARAGLLPTIAIDYSKTKAKQNILSADNSVYATGTSSFPITDTSLSLTQPVFRLSAWRNFDKAKASVRQAAATYAASEQDLMVRTAAAYLDVLAARDAVGFAQAERQSIKEQFELVQGKYKSGQSTVVNLRDAEARLAIKEADIVAAQNDLSDKVQALGEIIGKSSDDLAPLKADLKPVAPAPSDEEQWVQTSLTQNLLLQAREQAVEVAQQEVLKQKAGYYPTVDLSWMTDRKNTGGSLFGGGSNVRENDLTFRVHVPLYEGGATQAVTTAAARRHESALDDRERDRRQVERQARAAYQGVVGGSVRISALTQSVTSLEQARQLKTEGYKSGLQTILAVLDAERDLYAAKRDLAKARYDYLRNTLKLKQAAGSLGETDLASVAQFGQ
jgi:outer membrane protein